jgi:hypothetical protein
MRFRLALSACIAANVIVAANAWQPLLLGHIEIKLTPAMSGYCHIISFPQGWAMPRLDDHHEPLIFDYANEYEFRVRGVLGTEFLVGVFKKMVGHRYDAVNRYKVDLSHPSAPVLPISRAAWDASAVVPQTRKGIFPPGETMPSERRAEFHGFQFARTGDFWAQPSQGASRLSPDQAWLVLQSMTGTPEHIPNKVFFDVFSAETGKKLLLIEGAYFSAWGTYDPDGALDMTGWITERYFVVPLGEHKEQFMVCEFGGLNRKLGAKR